jgi:hypothetical protein
LIEHYQIFELIEKSLALRGDFAFKEDSIILGDLWVGLACKN